MARRGAVTSDVYSANLCTRERRTASVACAAPSANGNRARRMGENIACVMSATPTDLGAGLRRGLNLETLGEIGWATHGRESVIVSGFAWRQNQDAEVEVFAAVAPRTQDGAIDFERVEVVHVALGKIFTEAVADALKLQASGTAFEDDIYIEHADQTLVEDKMAGAVSFDEARLNDAVIETP
jgi:hypothetical protein